MEEIIKEMFKFLIKRTGNIFCEECKYLVDDVGNYICRYKDNIREINDQKWRHEIGCFVSIRIPSKINRYNDCGWFEKDRESHVNDQK